MKFRASIQLHGKTATGIEVPPEVVEGLGSHKRPPVRVTLNDFTYRTTIAPMGGVFMILLSADVRSASGAAASDEVDVGIEITLHTEPREGGIPEDFATELARNTPFPLSPSGPVMQSVRRLGPKSNCSSSGM